MADEGIFHMRPLGFMQSVFKYKNGTPRQPSLCTTARGSLTLMKTVFNNPEHALEGLEQFSHAWIIFVFHKNKNVHTKAKVKPPRLNGQKVGVLSTRSPYRPNAIGLTLAKIEQIRGSSIEFSGIDIVDGTPVLDIKPFIPQYDLPASYHDYTRGSNNSSLLSDQHSQPEMHPELKANCVCNINNESTSLDEKHNSVKSVKSLLSDSSSFEKKVRDCSILHIPEDRREWLASSTLLSSGSFQSEELHTVVNLKQDARLPPELTGTTGPVNTLSEEESNDSFPIETSIREIDLKNAPSMIINSTKQSVPGSMDNGDTITVAEWLNSPPVTKLHVSFTPSAEIQLQNFHQQEALKPESDYRLQFLSGEEEIRTSILSVLSEDPRSVYRREKCSESLYFFTVDNIHVTCWFDKDRVEVVKVQPLHWVDKLSHNHKPV